MASIQGLNAEVARLSVVFDADIKKASAGIAEMNRRFETAEKRARATAIAWDRAAGAHGRLNTQLKKSSPLGDHARSVSKLVGGLDKLRDGYNEVHGSLGNVNPRLNTFGSHLADVSDGAREAQKGARGLHTSLGTLEKRLDRAGRAGIRLGPVLHGLGDEHRQLNDDVRASHDVYNRFGGLLNRYTRNARSAQAATRALGNSGRGLHGLGGGLSALGAHVAGPAIAAGVTALATALVSAGTSAISLAAALAPLAGLLATLPGLAAAAGSGVGVLALAFMGIVPALKAMRDADKNAAKDAADAATRRENAAERIRGAIERVRDAQESLTDAIEQSARRNRDAQESIRTANDSLVAAQRRARDTQMALTAARIEARRRLMELKYEVQDLGLSEERAALNVEQATARLEMVRLSGIDAMSFERREAELSAREALAQLDEVNRKHNEAKAEQTKAAKAGVEGSDQVKDAQRDLVDAQKGVADAARDAAKAQQDAAEAQRDGIQAVERAHRNLANAVREQGLAQRQAGRDMKETSASALKLKDAMDQLSPAGQHFVKTLYSLRGVLKQLSGAAQETILPHLETGLQKLTKLVPDVEYGIRKVGGAIGHLIDQGVALVTSGPWRSDFRSLTDANARLIGQFGTAGLNLADALRNVTMAAGPLTDWLGRLVVRWSDNIKGAAELGRKGGKDGPLGRFFEQTRQVAEKVFDILGDVGGALWDIFKISSPSGLGLLDELEQATGKLKQLLDVPANADRLQRFFANSADTIRFVGATLREAARFAFLFFERAMQVGSALEQLSQQHPGIAKFAAALALVGVSIGGIVQFAQFFGRQGGMFALLGSLGSLVGLLAGTGGAGGVAAGGLGAVAAAAAPLIAIVGVLAAAIVGLVALFAGAYIQSRPFRDAIANLGRALRDILVPAFHTVHDVLVNRIFPAFKQGFRIAGGIMAAGIDQITSALRDNAPQFNQLLQVITKVFGFLTTYVTPALIAFGGVMVANVFNIVAAGIRVIGAFLKALEATAGHLKGIFIAAGVAASALALPFGRGLLDAAGNLNLKVADLNTNLEQTKPAGTKAKQGMDLYKEALDAAKQAQKSAVESFKRYKEALGQQRDAVKDVIPAFRDLGDTGKTTAKDLLKDLEQSAVDLEGWSKNMKTLLKRGVDPAVVKDLSEKGPKYVAAFANASDTQLAKLEGFYKRRTKAATDVATTQTKLGGGQAADAYKDALAAKKEAVKKAAEAALSKKLKDATNNANKIAKAGGASAGTGYATALRGQRPVLERAASYVINGMSKVFGRVATILPDSFLKAMGMAAAWINKFLHGINSLARTLHIPLKLPDIVIATNNKNTIRTRHTGGMAGEGPALGNRPLRGDEYPHVLQKGEGVVNKRAMARQGGRSWLNSVNAGEETGGPTNNLNRIPNRGGRTVERIISLLNARVGKGHYRVTSTTGGKHSANSLHYTGNAVDVAASRPGDVAGMRRIWSSMVGAAPWYELFFDYAPYFISRGQRHAGAFGGHKDHLHLGLLAGAAGGAGGGTNNLNRIAAANPAGPLVDKLFGPIASGLKRGVPGPMGAIVGGILNQLRDGAKSRLGSLAGAVSGIVGGVTDFVGNASSGANRALGRAMAARRGWTGSQWTALDRLIISESGWRNTAQNPTSTAFGIGQFLSSTWAGVGGHKTANPALQIEYMLRYVAQRYGNPGKAWAFKQAHNWYQSGTSFVPRTGPYVLHKGEAVTSAADNRSARHSDNVAGVYIAPGAIRVEIVADGISGPELRRAGAQAGDEVAKRLIAAIGVRQ